MVAVCQKPHPAFALDYLQRPMCSAWDSFMVPCLTSIWNASIPMPLINSNVC